MAQYRENNVRAALVAQSSSLSADRAHTCSVDGHENFDHDRQHHDRQQPDSMIHSPTLRTPPPRSRQRTLAGHHIRAAASTDTTARVTVSTP